MSTLMTRRVATLGQHSHRIFRRCQSTLDSNPNIYVFKSPSDPSASLLSLLKTNPPTESLVLGTTYSLPPDPYAFKENPRFTSIMHSVIAENAHRDPQIQGQAGAMASAGGASLFQPKRRMSAGFGGASDQGGAGSGGRGGWVHVSDNRHPPDFGRIAEPEDIFGSVEVDGNGQFVDGHGRYQISGTYRLVTKEGVLDLPPFLMKKLKERLELEEAAEKNNRK